VLSNAPPESSAFITSFTVDEVSFTSSGAVVDGSVSAVVFATRSPAPCISGAVADGREAISRFFRSSKAFINRAFSGVMVGDFGPVASLTETLELVVGLPLLVCGRICGNCKDTGTASET
jgi:hypothetical protein